MSSERLKFKAGDKAYWFNEEQVYVVTILNGHLANRGSGEFYNIIFDDIIDNKDMRNVRGAAYYPEHLKIYDSCYCNPQEPWQTEKCLDCIPNLFP